ncbi:type I pantothenate kinase [Roseococcus pinisoli]|uniref:Pantothenate kinase n=1 Tax=Roseococcus pinisoli TaxID=2835040 RepID=A0ABS5QG24_9PROT|nr:type I pantothenate kinase [Roseococcus pinisoli]MBS7812507.1 type I pantothenate kinase [Roseococcus pinisoli]
MNDLTLGPQPAPPRSHRHSAPAGQDGLYSTFSREEWSQLGKDRISLSPEELEALRSTAEPASPTDIEEIFGPLCRLIRLHVEASHSLSARIAGSLLRKAAAPKPYIIGIAGSVAVGKSTFARLLQALLARHSNAWRVDLVATDGFLFPTATLEARGLMKRKGFPESYDLRGMVRFLSEMKAGASELEIPVYSHEAYDVVPGSFQKIRQPDILIFEGLNVLQTARDARSTASDFFDFSVYLDAEPSDIARWYKDRFLLLQRSVFQRPTSYFHHYKDLSPKEAARVAAEIWQSINLPNLTRNILPTRDRARVILHKDAAHRIVEVRLRQGP